jgi:hypothetical protein
MSAMKLQKLLFYSQAWSHVWDDNLRSALVSRGLGRTASPLPPPTLFVRNRTKTAALCGLD